MTFRIPQTPSTSQTKTHATSGSLSQANVFVSMPANRSSLASKKGVDAKVNVEEKPPGLPSCSGSYLSDSVGSHLLAVLNLQSGGLNSNCCENEWLLDSPVIKSRFQG